MQFDHREEEEEEEEDFSTDLLLENGTLHEQDDDDGRLCLLLLMMHDPEETLSIRNFQEQLLQISLVQNHYCKLTIQSQFSKKDA